MKCENWTTENSRTFPYFNCPHSLVPFHQVKAFAIKMLNSFLCCVCNSVWSIAIYLKCISRTLSKRIKHHLRCLIVTHIKWVVQCANSFTQFNARGKINSCHLKSPSLFLSMKWASWKCHHINQYLSLHMSDAIASVESSSFSCGNQCCHF